MRQHCVSGYHTTLHFVSMSHPSIIFNITQILQLCYVISKIFRSLFVLNPHPYYLLRTPRKVFISKSIGDKFVYDLTPVTSLQHPSSLCSHPEYCGMFALHLAKAGLANFFRTLPSFICKSSSPILNSPSLYMFSYGSYLELQSLHRTNRRQKLICNL